VLRPDRDRFQVLLVRRNDAVAFMAGAHVFPGGRVDDADRNRGGEAAFLSQPPRFVDLSPHEELPYRQAAARELTEEASVSVDIDALLPIAHWVTPAVEPRRYDTRFFLTLLPEGQQARHDAGETTDLVWCAPEEAVDRARAGDIVLPPPTWTTLRALGDHSTLPSVLEWARSTPIARIEPRLVSEGGRKMLTLPGDAFFPAIEGWPIPRETRFVLEEGRGWLPVGS
jgi:8-oxo-dGTP pyrophosphatase MutT (NUDIX family)